MTAKNVADMSNAEFDAAMKARAWRGQQAPPADPAAVAEAKRRRWPLTEAALADAAKLLNATDDRGNNTSSTAQQPVPAAPTSDGKSAVNGMSGPEFDRAVRNRAWRR